MQSSSQPKRSIGYGWFKQGIHRTNMEVFKGELSDDGTVFIQGKDGIGQFTITGNANKLMTKQYNGAHKVDYRGRIEDDKIVGNWHLTTLEGPFEFPIIHADTHSWKGFLFKQATQMPFEATIDANFTHVLVTDVPYLAASEMRVLPEKKKDDSQVTLKIVNKDTLDRPAAMTLLGFLVEQNEHYVVKGTYKYGNEVGYFTLVRQ